MVKMRWDEYVTVDSNYGKLGAVRLGNVNLFCWIKCYYGSFSEIQNPIIRICDLLLK